MILIWKEGHSTLSSKNDDIGICCQNIKEKNLVTDIDIDRVRVENVSIVDSITSKLEIFARLWEVRINS